MSDSLDLNKSSPSLSIVVVCAGQLEYTRLCVHSLLRHGVRTAEHIFVDVASWDGTRPFLQGVALAAPRNIRVRHVDDEVSYAKGCSMGASLATGEYLVFLNNDTIVTAGWLDQMVGLASHDPKIGMVGAMSNAAPAAQSVGAVTYRLPSQESDGSDADRNAEETVRSLIDLDNFAKD